VAACAGPITTRSGLEGPSVPAASAVALAPAAEDAGSAARAARVAVAQALESQGYRLSSEAPLRIEVALSERAADVDVRALGGPTLSPAKTARLFQDCRDRTHRLTLAVIDLASPPTRTGVTRAFAEEHHCKGTLAASLPSLAEQAVAALGLGGAERSTIRSGKD
jgi:hypothetical protein